MVERWMETKEAAEGHDMQSSMRLAGAVSIRACAFVAKPRIIETSCGPSPERRSRMAFLLQRFRTRERTTRGTFVC
eukprot:scaffold64_cov338-Pavlova_lutheri.AAC.18